MSDRSTLLLEHYLKELKLPTFLREYGKLAAQCAAEGADHPDYLLRLAELELTDRHQRMVERRVRPRLPRHQGPRHLRLLRHPLGEPGAGHAARPVRIRRTS